MLTATEFTYDGVYSEKYGLKIATFDGAALEETSYIVPTIEVAKSATSNKFHYLDRTYDSPPTFNFSVVSEEEIHEEILREILIWLDARRGFKPLVIMQPGFDELTYNCIFTVTSLIYHSGRCVGLNLSATFDSNYILGKPIEINVFGQGELQSVDLYNDSDNIDTYIFPKVEFDTSDGAVSIINTTDNSTREFAFSGLNPNTTYVVDNELKIITGEGRNLLEKFSKNWLRVLRGKNRLKIRVNGAVTISCPRYVKISF